MFVFSVKRSQLADSV